MKKSPCKDCEKSGCGAYHDKCAAHQEYRTLVRKAKEWDRSIEERRPIGKYKAFEETRHNRF